MTSLNSMFPQFNVIVKPGFSVRVSIQFMRLYRNKTGNAEELSDKHPGESCQIRANKGYTGEMGSEKADLVIPDQLPPRGYLSQLQLRVNTIIAWSRVVIKNYFGRLSAKFSFLVRRWSFDKELDSRVFSIDFPLANFEMCLRGELTLRHDDGEYDRKILPRTIIEGSAEKNGEPMN
jgi:hypothetical protein